MIEDEQKATYAFIAEENKASCPGLTAGTVQAIHYSLMNNGIYTGPFSGDPCFSLIRSGLEAQGLLAQNETAEEVAHRLMNGNYNPR